MKPILLYGSDAWGANISNTKTDKVQLEYLKLVLSVKQSTCTIMVYGETGRFPIDLDAQGNAIKYYVRLRKMNDNMLGNQVFNQLHYLHDTGFKTWNSYILNLLKQQNINVQQESLEAILSTYKMKAYDSYINEWQNSMNEISFPIL